MVGNCKWSVATEHQKSRTNPLWIPMRCLIMVTICRTDDVPFEMWHHNWLSRTLCDLVESDCLTLRCCIAPCSSCHSYVSPLYYLYVANNFTHKWKSWESTDMSYCPIHLCDRNVSCATGKFQLCQLCTYLSTSYATLCLDYANFFLDWCLQVAFNPSKP